MELDILYLLQSKLTEKVKEREDKILTRLCHRYQKGELTDLECRNGIAGISELRVLLKETGYDIKIREIPEKRLDK